MYHCLNFVTEAEGEPCAEFSYIESPGEVHGFPGIVDAHPFSRVEGRRRLPGVPDEELLSRQIPIAAQLTRDYFHLEERTEDIMAEWLSLSREAYAAQVSLKPGAAEFLEKCAQAGEDMVLFTACVPELCQTALDRFGLTKYFQQAGQKYIVHLHPNPVGVGKGSVKIKYQHKSFLQFSYIESPGA